MNEVEIRHRGRGACYVGHDHKPDIIRSSSAVSKSGETCDSTASS